MCPRNRPLCHQPQQIVTAIGRELPGFARANAIQTEARLSQELKGRISTRMHVHSLRFDRLASLHLSRPPLASCQPAVALGPGVGLTTKATSPVRDSSRRIMIMRFRSADIADIRVINHRIASCPVTRSAPFRPAASRRREFPAGSVTSKKKTHPGARLVSEVELQSHLDSS